MLSSNQESNLVSGGDCFEHYHSSDRVVTHDDAVALTELEKTQLAINGATVVSKDADYVLVDTASGNATLTLPHPNGLRRVVVLKTAAANTVTISSPVGTINGVATLVLSAAYAVATLKAIGGNYYKVA